MLEDSAPAGGRVADHDEDEPISPELALIDPELVTRIRAAADTQAAPPPLIRYFPTSREQALRLAAAELPVPTERRRSSRPPILLVAIVFVLGSAGAAAAWNLLLARDEQSALPEVRPSGLGDTRAQTAEAVEPPVRTTPKAAPTTRAAVPPPARRKKAPVPAKPRPAAPPAARPAPALPPAALLAPPLFTWPAVPGARSYRLVLYRGGTRIYEAVTLRPRQALPLRWTFGGKRYRLKKGTYRWVVLPRLNTKGALRDGKAIVDASYTV